MTTYQIVDVAIADHPNLVKITRDLDLEALARIPGIIDAWTPGPQYITGTTGTDFRFRGRIHGRELIAQRSEARPAESTVGGEMLLGVGVDGLPVDGSTANGVFGYTTTEPLPEWSASFFVSLEATAARAVMSLASAEMQSRIEVFSDRLRTSPHRPAAGTPVDWATTAPAPVSGGSFVITLAYDGSRLATRVNGQDRTSQGFTGTPSVPRFWFAGGSDPAITGGAGAGLRFGSVFLASRDLTTTPDDLTAIEGYLMQRYGITPA